MAESGTGHSTGRYVSYRNTERVAQRGTRLPLGEACTVSLPKLRGSERRHLLIRWRPIRGNNALQVLDPSLYQCGGGRRPGSGASGTAWQAWNVLVVVGEKPHRRNFAGYQDALPWGRGSWPRVSTLRDATEPARCVGRPFLASMRRSRWPTAFSDSVAASTRIRPAPSLTPRADRLAGLGGRTMGVGFLTSETPRAVSVGPSTPGADVSSWRPWPASIGLYVRAGLSGRLPVSGWFAVRRDRFPWGRLSRSSRLARSHCTVGHE